MKDKKMMSVRVETWDKQGNNLEWTAEEAMYKDLDAAIDRARELYIAYNKFVPDIQITISEDSKRVWKYYSGKSGILDDRQRFI